MAKYLFTIEASSAKELIQRIEEELTVMHQDERELIEHDLRMKKKFVCVRKKKKHWDESEDQFLIENYRKKKLAWVANALGRPLTSIYQRLNKLYKKYPQMPKLK